MTAKKKKDKTELRMSDSLRTFLSKIALSKNRAGAIQIDLDGGMKGIVIGLMCCQSHVDEFLREARIVVEGQETELHE